MHGLSCLPQKADLIRLHEAVALAVLDVVHHVSAACHGHGGLQVDGLWRLRF